MPEPVFKPVPPRVTLRTFSSSSARPVRRGSLGTLNGPQAKHVLRAEIFLRAHMQKSFLVI